MQDYDYWLRNLAGDPDAPKPRDGHPQCGFYKMRRGKDSPWIPVAIWKQNGEIVAGAGENFAQSVNPAKVWLSCAKYPVTEASARHAAEYGRWPDEPPPMPADAPVEQPRAGADDDAPRLGIGGNNPPEDATILEQYADLPTSERALISQLGKQADEAEDWLKKTKIETKEQADLAANWAARIKKLNEDVDKLRMNRRRPLQTVLDKIQGFFKPAQDKAKAATAALEKAARDWARAEEARLREEARRKAEEEARRLAEEQRKKFEQEGLPLEAAPPPPQPKPVEAPRVLVGGATGKRIGTRKPKRVGKIVNVEEALLFFKDHPDILVVLQKLVDKVIAAGGSVPGVEAVDQDEAA